GSDEDSRFGKGNCVRSASLTARSLVGPSPLLPMRNPRPRSDACFSRRSNSPGSNRFAIDSQLEGTGSELSVPPSGLTPRPRDKIVAYGRGRALDDLFAIIEHPSSP